MQMAHSVSPSRHPQRENSHIERIAKTTELHKFLFGDAEIVPEARKMFFHHGQRKSVVPCGHRCVRCEKARGANLFGRLFKGLSLLNELSRPLEQHEGRVTFIRMKHVGLNSQGPEDAYSAYSK